MDLLAAFLRNVHLVAVNGGLGRFKIPAKTTTGRIFAMVDSMRWGETAPHAIVPMINRDLDLHIIEYASL